ncbi:hypothetical protein [Paraburkholderia sp. J67]|uniref:hypothetical protein n=1 Tax=Paraburkholderia sp. J67 TaxID=2805435 RepID=UPI002ABDA9CD|nr:hypothetical protein [Paraburkholderia sp. J67]
MGSRKLQPKKALSRRTRQSSRLYLPLDSTSANREALRIRIALERARKGNADRATLHCLVYTTLLAELLCHSTARESLSCDIAMAKAGLAALLEQAPTDCTYEFSSDLMCALTATVNEHERQLLAVRLGTIVEATERLESRLRHSPSLMNLLVVSAL